MIFASDNWSGASPQIVEAVAEAARRGGPAYGNDPLTKAVEQRFSDLFEREVAVFPVGTGTIANALSLGHFARPGGVVLAHREAHVLVDEPGSTELFGGGTRPVALDGPGGKLTPAAVVAGFERYPAGNTFHGNVVAVTLTQMTELGTVYHPQEIAAIAEIAHSRGAALHMDGARFASAVVSLGASPADITWRAGVDIMSFGGTKNGCLAAEAVVIFDPAKANGFAIARQRAGQTFSKGWFMAAQLDAYLRDGHWLALARHAADRARELAAAIDASKNARLALRPAANEIFAFLAPAALDRLRSAGAAFYPWSTASLPEGAAPRQGEQLVRLVTSFATTSDEIARFTAALGAAG
jgi:threonine aldolase